MFSNSKGVELGFKLIFFILVFIGAFLFLVVLFLGKSINPAVDALKNAIGKKMKGLLFVKKLFRTPTFKCMNDNITAFIEVRNIGREPIKIEDIVVKRKIVGSGAEPPETIQWGIIKEKKLLKPEIEWIQNLSKEIKTRESAVFKSQCSDELTPARCVYKISWGEIERERKVNCSGFRPKNDIYVYKAKYEEEWLQLARYSKFSFVVINGLSSKVNDVEVKATVVDAPCLESSLRICSGDKSHEEKVGELDQGNAFDFSHNEFYAEASKYEIEIKLDGEGKIFCASNCPIGEERGWCKIEEVKC